MSEKNPHPVLIIPHGDGVLLVIGEQQIFKSLTTNQQIQLAIEILKSALQR